MESKAAIEKREQTVIRRKKHYNDLISNGLIDEESLQQTSRRLATGNRIAKGLLDSVAGALALTPQFGVFTSLNYGGRELHKFLYHIIQLDTVI